MKRNVEAQVLVGMITIGVRRGCRILGSIQFATARDVIARLKWWIISGLTRAIKRCFGMKGIGSRYASAAMIVRQRERTAAGADKLNKKFLKRKTETSGHSA